MVETERGAGVGAFTLWVPPERVLYLEIWDRHLHRDTAEQAGNLGATWTNSKLS